MTALPQAGMKTISAAAVTCAARELTESAASGLEQPGQFFCPGGGNFTAVGINDVAARDFTRK